VRWPLGLGLLLTLAVQTEPLMADQQAVAEVDLRIQSIETPFGDGPHQRQSEAARQWLRVHADVAYPRLLRRAQTAGSPAVYAALADFARSESVPVLARALAAGGSHADAAARALALHPQESAGQALREALGQTDPLVRMAAADGLLMRADQADCAALRARLTDPDALVRYHVLQAGAHLGCLDRAVVASIARTDADTDVRNLAAKMLAPTPAP
jgi:HEAT repeat protein